MQITVDGPDGRRDVDVVFGPSTTVADLTTALAAAPGVATTIDGSSAAGTASPHDAGLVAGSVLAAGPAPEPTGGDSVRLAILAGPGAGATVALGAGRHRLGGPGSGEGVTLRVAPSGAVHAGDARPGRRIGPGTVISVGDVVVGVLPAVEDVSRQRPVPGRRGTAPFNRPPRQLPSAGIPAVYLPVPPEPRPTTTRVGVAALAVPLLLAGVMALLYDPRFALFGLLGPVMLAGTWAEDRRRLRRHARDSAAAEAAAVDTLRRDMGRACAAEVIRRRRHHPTVPELAARAAGSPGLWERLPDHPDFMVLGAEYGSVPWQPPLDGDPGSAPDAVYAALSAVRLPTAPVPLTLTARNVLGVAGPRSDALALARGLVAQVVTLHGPAHVQVAVVTDHPDDWDWVKWAPHTLARSSSGHRLLAATPVDEATVIGFLLPSPPPHPVAATPPAGPAGPLTLVVVDVDDLSQPDHTALRHVLGGRGVPVTGLVLARQRSRLPSSCTAVAEVATGTVRLDPGSGGRHRIVGATAEAAVALARRLACWDDPDRPDDGAELPAAVPLLEVLGMPVPGAEAVMERWRGTGRPAAPIGVTDAGPLVVDLLTDGPHGLLAGTTGSGKSELLRTLVASLAATVDPERLVFVLVDYKGGSAFDACAALPHIAGMVTDLDDSLAERALRCLEAELRHREERLRRAGADGIVSFTPGPGDDPLPRMLIVIDEFAALAKELPDFMDALVDIAARGRSLGVHLLLATQRPSGVIRDSMRANTNLRIALRVQDGGDSTDVIGDARAAVIARSQPGRGYLRLGPTEVVAFQAAIVSGHSAGGGGGVVVRPFLFGAEPPAAPPPAGAAEEASTDLDLLVAAVAEAADRMGSRPVRRPWPDPLPDRLTTADLPVAVQPAEYAVPIGLVDEPDEQRQAVRWWDPGQGSAILYGVAGSGTTTALATMALGLAAARPPDAAHIYILDCDAGGLAPLADLPHVGAVLALHERERHSRLLRMLSAEMDLRLAGSGRSRRAGADPAIVLLVDGYHAFAAAHDGIHGGGVKDVLDRLIADGPAVGISAVVSVSRYNALPSGVAGAVEAKLLFRCADPTAATMLGVRSLPGDMPPGRCIETATGRLVQVAFPDGGIAAAAAEGAAAWPATRGGPPPVEELPVVVKVPDVADWLHLDDDVWHIPVGIGDHLLAPAGWRLGEGDHVLVAGEPRSGRSTLLAALATMVSERVPAAAVVGIAPRRSPLREVPGLTRLVTDPGDIGSALTDIPGDGPSLVLIDDADELDDHGGALARLAAQRHPRLHVVAAARRDLKGRHGHWARDLCRSRQGLWLKPSEGVDGDLWSTPLPRRVPTPMPPGRGYLICEGTVEVVQAVRY